MYKFNEIVKIDNIEIGKNKKPYIIAEMSANHGHDIEVAIKIIKEAKKCGADAIKIQTYTADTMTLNCKKEEYQAKGAWEGQYLYDLYLDAYTPWEWTPKLIEIANEVGITLFSSPFDYSSVDFLEEFNMPAYKIASPEIIDLPLVRKIARTKKPIIMSTGNATISQINDAVAILIEENVKDLIILKCTSEYPANPKNINLATIPHLKEIFKCPIGLSDHTLGSAIPISSVALGACVIEKHFILNRDYKTADSFFSATPNELKEIVDGSKMVSDAIGKVDYPIIENKAQRSLIAIKDIPKDEELKEGINFKSLRPGGGIKPKYLDLVDGKIAKQNIEFGTLLSWDLLT